MPYFQTNPYTLLYPLVMTNVAIGNGPVEIVDKYPLKMVDLSSSLCKRLPEGNIIHNFAAI